MSGQKGRQGRKPKASTIAERLAGQRGGAALAGARLPAPPSHLSREAKREWRRKGQELVDAGLLSDLDTTALALYCDAYARWVEAKHMLEGPAGRCDNCVPGKRSRDAHGLPACDPPRLHQAFPYGRLVRGRLGKTEASPYQKIANEAWQQMRQILGEFGMTPASRSRIPREQLGARRRPQEVPSWRGAPEQVEDPRVALQVIQGGKR